jgi:hypothetical protein
MWLNVSDCKLISPTPKTPTDKRDQAGGFKNRDREKLQKDGLKGVEKVQPPKILAANVREFIQQVEKDRKELAAAMEAEGIAGNELKEKDFTKKWKKNWEGKSVRITGFISEIKAGSTSGLGKAGKEIQSAVIYMQGGEAKFFFNLDNEPELEKVKALDRGKSVIIEGTVTGYWRTAIYVTNCCIVNGDS